MFRQAALTIPLYSYIIVFYMHWVTTNIRLPEDVYLRLKMKAARERTSIAALIREQLGFHEAKGENTAGTAALLNLAHQAEKSGVTGPSDLATEHNSYFDKSWKEKQDS